MSPDDPRADFALDALRGAPFDPVALRARLLAEVDELRQQRPIDKWAVLVRLQILRAIDTCAELVPGWLTRLTPVPTRETQS